MMLQMWCEIDASHEMDSNLPITFEQQKSVYSCRHLRMFQRM